MILFAQREGIVRVSANGGVPEVVIKVKEGEHVHGPQLLPDGDSVLFSVTTATGRTRWDEAQIVVQSLRTGQRTVLSSGGSDARYVPTGHLIYALRNGLFAVAFDPDRMRVHGETVSLVDGVVRQAELRVAGAVAGATANYGVSEQGTLVYMTGVAPTQRSLAWVDRQGREEPLGAPPRSYLYPRVSPDGTRIAVSSADQQIDIWVWELASDDPPRRFTFNPDSDTYPAWTSGGKRLLFSSTLDGEPGNVFWQAADGSGSPEPLAKSPTNLVPQSVSPDERRVVLREGNMSNYDLAVLLLPERRKEPLLHTKHEEQNGEISPDSRWLAYQSNESGQREVYVRPFPNVDGGKWQVSSGGGTRPLWARNGPELFYMAIAGTEAAVMSVRFERVATWKASAPTKLFTGPFFFNDAGPGIGRTYDVSLDGRRFLMIKDSAAGNVSDVPSPRFVVVENWFEELKRRVPTK